jgi:Domain of unknown function (DUF4160)
MPEISRFFGIIVRMYYDDHPPPHIHAEYQGNKAKIDFAGNVLLGDLRSNISPEAGERMDRSARCGTAA